MTFAGYAAVFGHPDRGGDVVKAGAFARALKGEPGAVLCSGSTNEGGQSGASLVTFPMQPRRGRMRRSGSEQVSEERQPAILRPSGGTIFNAEARSTLAQIIAALMSHGLIE